MFILVLIGLLILISPLSRVTHTRKLVENAGTEKVIKTDGASVLHSPLGGRAGGHLLSSAVGLIS